MTEKQTLSGRCLVQADGVSLKTYLFQDPKFFEESIAKLKQVIKTDVHGLSGVGIAFSCRSEDGFRKYANIFTYYRFREEESGIQPCAIHYGSAALDKVEVMHRIEPDELLLLAKEEEHRRKCLAYLRQGTITEREAVRLFLERFPE